MSQITLPQGVSLRQVAERLGVSVEDLQKHAGVSDAEAPMPVAKAIEVPDGFLRSRIKQEQLRDAVTATSGKKAGMNMWLAMDIEQKRTRASGGMKAKEAGEHEIEGLAEARRAYLRFEMTSNELAISLYGNLSSTHSIHVRAQAFAGQALALAQRTLLFREPVARSKTQAMSAAKAAQLADPKLADTHLGMALALCIAGTAPEIQEAHDELCTAIRCDKTSPWPHVELARMALASGATSEAHDYIREALQLDAQCVLALEVAARLAEAARDWPGALELWESACAATPSYRWAHVGAVRTLRHLGRHPEATARIESTLNEEDSTYFHTILREEFMADGAALV